jgi:hypothetical protein
MSKELFNGQTITTEPNSADRLAFGKPNTAGSKSMTWANFKSILTSLIGGTGSEQLANKGQPNGYTPLDSSAKVPSMYLPSYVDDVIEVANEAALPVTGESGKIYFALLEGTQWRWGGTAYVEIVSSPASTDSVAEGSTNLYHTSARVRATTLTGVAENATREQIAATDSVLSGFGKLMKWFSDLKTVAFSGSYNDLSDKPTFTPVMPYPLNNEVITAGKNKKHVIFNPNVMSVQTAYWSGSSWVSDTGSMAVGNDASKNNSKQYVSSFGSNSCENNDAASVTAAGYFSARNNLGYNLSAIGVYSATNNTGGNVSAIGYSSVYNNTGLHVSAVGSSSAHSNIGSYVSAIGTFSAYSNAGTHVSAVGFSAAYFNKGTHVNATGYMSSEKNTAPNVISIGQSSLQYNNWPQVSMVGANPTAYFNEDLATTKNFTDANVDSITKRITITSHGFVGSAFINLKFKVVSGSAPGGLTHGQVYQFLIVDANTLECSLISSVGSGTFSLTNSINITNSSGLGHNAIPTKSNQIKLGDDNVTEAMVGDSVNNVQITTTGIKLNGTATVFEDDNLDPTTMTGNGNLPTLIPFASTNINIAAFSATQLDNVEGKREIPHQAKLGAPITFHAHVYPTNTNTGVVRLGLEYFFSRENVAVTTSTTIYVEMAMSGTAWAKKSIGFEAITPPSELGSQFHFRFFRDGAHTNDTYNANLAISTIGYHYEIDSLGSNELLVK